MGTRGSLKWIQRAVNTRQNVFDPLILSCSSGASSLRWLSPLAGDDFAEYRDGDFLARIGCSTLSAELKLFWPSRGPQWDALAVTDTADVILIEAKAHIPEIMSGGCQAKAKSLALIEASFASVISALGAEPRISWTGPLYQTANRIAHLYFLRAHGMRARLIFVCFVGDAEMRGCEQKEWEGALKFSRELLGLPERHALSDYISYVFPPVTELR